MENSSVSPLRAIWLGIKRVFSSQESIPSPAVPIEEENKENYKVIFDGLGEMPAIPLEEDLISGKKFFLEYMTRIGERFRAAGEEDGEIEQKNYAINDIVRTRVLQIQAFLASTFRGEFNRSDVDVKLKDEVLKNAKNEYDAQTEYAKTLRKRYNENYKEFSAGLGYVYLIAAVILVAADYPLALKLTQDGFQLKEWWATPLMSLGLALSTLYIKIFYDEFVGSSAEQSVTRFSEISGVEGEDQLRTVKRSWWGKSAVKVLILAVSFSTIIVLGFFRFQVYEPGLKDIIKDPNDYANYVNSLTKAAFILITLLFPLIGGVCASLGFDRLQNSREDKTIGEKCKQKELAQLKASKDLEEAKKKRAVSVNFLKWCGESIGDETEPSGAEDTVSDFLNDYTLYFIACYIHGYERGTTRNNLHQDMFSKATEFRKRMVAQKAAEITQKTTPEDFYDNLKGLSKASL